MTVVARRIKATPARSANDAWAVIVDLLTQQESDAHDELLSIKGVVSSLIASEAMKSDPIVVYGGGPRVRVYCVYGEDAVIGEDANESSLGFRATDGDWSMSLPTPEEDLDWVKAMLSKKTARVTARPLGEAVPDEPSGDKSRTASNASVNKEAFFRS